MCNCLSEFKIVRYVYLPVTPEGPDKDGGEDVVGETEVGWKVDEVLFLAFVHCFSCNIPPRCVEYFILSWSTDA